MDILSLTYTFHAFQKINSTPRHRAAQSQQLHVIRLIERRLTWRGQGREQQGEVGDVPWAMLKGGSRR